MISRIVRSRRLSFGELRNRMRRLRRCSRGVAAVEFAMVLPLMVLMLLGMTEVTFGVNMSRKLTLLSRSLADLTGRAQSMTSSDMTTIFGASTSIMQPYDSSKVKMVISSVVVTIVSSKPVGTVDWSCAQGTGAVKRSKGTTYAVPAGFESNSSFVVAEASLPYTPIFGYTLTGVINMSEITPWPVRNVAQVTWSGTAC